MVFWVDTEHLLVRQIRDVSRLIAEHSSRIRHLLLECIDWRRTYSAMQPLTGGHWLILRQVDVRGFGLPQHIKHMAFSQWDSNLFFESVTFGLQGSNHVIFRGMVEGCTKLARLNCLLVNGMAHSGSDVSHIWGQPYNGDNLETLEVSSLTSTHLEHTITLLSASIFPKLTTLSIHTRLITHNYLGSTPWFHLASSSPSLQHLMLPCGEEDLLLLLKFNPQMWSLLTYLKFFTGPANLYLITEMVAERHKAGVALEMIELNGWKGSWEEDDIKRLEQLVDVRFDVF